MKFRMSIRLKLFLSHLCAILFVSGSIGTIFYTSAMDSLISGVKERLEASAALISHTIDADDLDSIRTAEDMPQPIYIQTLDKLRELRRMNSDIAYMYIISRLATALSSSWIRMKRSARPFPDRNIHIVFQVSSGDSPAFPWMRKYRRMNGGLFFQDMHH